MKTTIDIKDDLLIRAKQLAERTGRPLRAVVEDSLRLMLSQGEQATGYKLKDLSFGEPAAEDPLESYSWHDLRAEIYDKPD